MRKCARKGCDCEFEPVKAIQKYCSRDCYLRVNVEKKRRKPHTVICSECGTEFSTANASQKRCSRDCMRVARAAYHRDRDRVPRHTLGALSWEEVVSWRYAESN